MAHKATSVLRSLYGEQLPIEIDIVEEPPHSYIGVGTGIIIVAETTTGQLLGCSALGKKGLPAEAVAENAVETLIHDIECESCVDQFMQDQLIIYMALAKGKSTIKCGPLTLHTQTAIYFTQLMTGANFKISDLHKNKSVLIECEGIGYQSQ